MNIHILPKYHRDNFPGTLESTHISSDFLWDNKESLFFANGKGAIHYLINKYGLNREDEVCIITSTNSNYVSTCVTGTIFNYAKISRVITDKTKMLYVIHEFGLPHPEIRNYVQLSRERKIPLVEDCAHSMDSTIDGDRIGTLGDYAIYSLAKIFPVDGGGLLVGKELQNSEYFNEAVDVCVRQQFKDHFQYLTALSIKRKDNFKLIRQAFNNYPTVFEFNESITPYFVIFVTEKYQYLYEELKDTGIEWGLTHVKNWFCVPTQPLMSNTQLKHLVAVLKGAFSEK
jgi:hypothetical protein